MQRKRTAFGRWGAPAVRILAAMAVFVGMFAMLGAVLPGASAEVAYLTPQPCPGCRTFTIDVPNQPTNTAFGIQDNQTIDIQVILPSGWSSVACADQYGVVARRDNSGALLPVPGWRCTVPTLNSLRFIAPRKYSSDVATKFQFRALSPGPVNSLAANFIEITQTYSDGEQQRLRAMKYLQARRQGANANPAQVTLPPDWVGQCTNQVGSTPNLLVSGWTCATTAGSGAHPRFRLDWTGGDPARYFYFHAYTNEDPPALTPIDPPPPLNLRIRDLMFDDGQIPTERVAYIRAGFLTGPTAAPSASPTPSPTSTTICGVTYNTGGTTATTAPGTLPLTTVGDSLTGSTVNNYYAPGINNGLNNGIGIGIGQGGCQPPPIVMDPCFGSAFSENGELDFAPPGRVRFPECAPPGGPVGPDNPYDAAVSGASMTPPTLPCIPQAVPRANRSEVRHPLHRIVGPTPPPVVMVAPDQPGGGVRPGDDAVVVVPPNANPQPTIQALLPQQQPGSTVSNQQPDCNLVASSSALPGTGGHSKPILKIAASSMGIGSALVAGALYWRRKSPHALRYVRR